MASLKGLFLGVHASNGVVRVLFLPLWYLMLFSPFLIAIAYFYGLGQTLQNLVPEDFAWFDLLPQVVLSAVFLLLPTRLLSGSGSNGKIKEGGKKQVPSLPYWIPGVRHLGSIISGGEEWLKGIGQVLLIRSWSHSNTRIANRPSVAL
jgi:hypothetical protein